MEKFEQYKMLSYLLNALKNKSLFSTQLQEIYEWHEEYGKNLIKFAWTGKAEEKDYRDFNDVLRSNKKQAMQTVKKFIETLDKKVKSLQKSPISILEKRLKFVAQLLELSETEQKVYGFLVRTKIDENFDDFNRSICGRNHKLINTTALFLAERQQNIDMLILFYSTNLTKEQIEGTDSDLFKQSGLINEVKKNVLNLPELLEAIDYTFSIQKSFNQLLKEFPIVYQKTLEDMKKNGKLTKK